jgi:hypothetical protein
MRRATSAALKNAVIRNWLKPFNPKMVPHESREQHTDADGALALRSRPAQLVSLAVLSLRQGD